MKIIKEKVIKWIKEDLEVWGEIDLIKVWMKRFNITKEELVQEGEQ